MSEPQIKRKTGTLRLGRIERSRGCTMEVHATRTARWCRQQQSIRLQYAVERNHCQCMEETLLFSAHAESTTFIQKKFHPNETFVQFSKMFIQSHICPRTDSSQNSFLQIHDTFVQIGLAGWGPEGWGPKPRKRKRSRRCRGPKGAAPKGGEPNISRFVFLSRSIYVFFFFLGGLLVVLWPRVAAIGLLWSQAKVSQHSVQRDNHDGDAT